jgi:hypothetical protein
VLASSNSGSLVTFTAGTKDVFVTYPAERALYTGGPLGTPASGTLTNCTGYTYANLSGTVPTWNQNTTGTAGNVTGLVAVANGGTGTATPSLVAGTNVTVTGTWPNQTIAASGGGGSATKTISNKTGAYTIVSGDLGTIINCTSGLFTVSLTAAATLGTGFTCTIWNTGTNAITIDPNAAETIDGVATLILRQGEGTDIVCNGTNWETSYKKTMRGYAENYLSTATRPVVSSGNNAIAIGNSYASGGDSFAAAIANNTSTYGAQSANSIAIGQQSRATAGQSVAIGVPYNSTGNLSSGTASYTFGDSCSASGVLSFAFGSESYSQQFGKYNYASGKFAARGDNQYGLMVLRAATTTTTAVVLTSNIGAASTTNQLIVASGQAMAIQGTLIAKQSGSGNMAGWTITGIVSNNAGTMAVSGLALTPIGVDSIVLGVNIPTIAVDNTNKGVTITSGFKAATNIRWVATVQTSEVTYA